MWRGKLGRSVSASSRCCRSQHRSGPSPVDRARPGSKHHFFTEGAGIPLSVSLTGGNRNDVTELESLLDAVPPVRGRPRQRPDELYGDRLRIRWERRDDIHEAFLSLAACVITWRHVTRLC